MRGRVLYIGQSSQARTVYQAGVRSPGMRGRQARVAVLRLWMATDLWQGRLWRYLIDVIVVAHMCDAVGRFGNGTD